METTLWIILPWIVKLTMIGLFTVFVVSVACLGRVTRRLYRHSSLRISPGELINGDSDADALAESALAGHVHSPAATETRVDCNSSLAAADVEKRLDVLRAAENKFQYLWEDCYAEVGSARRAIGLTALLTLLMMTSGAFRLYFGCFNNSRTTGLYCIMQTCQDLLDLLSLGLFLSALLCLFSNVLARKLAKRKASWTYLCSQLKSSACRH